MRSDLRLRDYGVSGVPVVFSAQSCTHAARIAKPRFPSSPKNRPAQAGGWSSVRTHPRAFNGLSLPDALRNHAAEGEDLDFLIKAAEGSRPGDYLHIMRGDLYFELGQPDLARDQYEIAGNSASPAAAEAHARLAALTQGGVAATDIKKLRTAAGANCTMCHGK